MNPIQIWDFFLDNLKNINNLINRNNKYKICEILFMGDVNINRLKYSKHNLALQYMDFLLSNRHLPLLTTDPNWTIVLFVKFKFSVLFDICFCISLYRDFVPRLESIEIFLSCQISLWISARTLL